ncbi:MAG: RlpA-like double-psi beta-barrel domain-containing protein [bacterium]
MKNFRKLNRLIILSIICSFLIVNYASAAVGRGYFVPQGQVAQVAGVKVENNIPVVINQTNAENKVETFNIDGSSSKAMELVSAFENEFQLLIPAQALAVPTGIEVIKIMEPMEIPWNLELASNIFQFDFQNDEAYVFGEDLEIELRYNHQDNTYYQVYFFDRSNQSWKPLATRDYPAENRIRAQIGLPFARIAVLANPGIMTSGKASWYGYQNCDCAASPDFPKGSLIRVSALNSNKSVIVTINDWGPERDKHPERVIDLDKVAFEKLAPLGSGVIDVKIEPLRVPADSFGRIMGIKVSGAGSQPIIVARSAMVMDQAGNVIFEKNSGEQLSLASLTKVIAMKVFLDTKPNLFKVVDYKLKDEEYNHLYVKPWESAKISLKEGDKILVKDLIYASLVSSSNNAVESLVRVSGMSREKFVERMNSIVKEWGTTSTHFIEPTGLSTENVSSAKDYAIISREAMQGILAQISATPEYSFKTINTNKDYKLVNTNWLVREHRPEIIGSKTGYLIESKHCLMNVVQVQDQKYFLVTLGVVNKNDSFADMNDLIKYIYKRKA